MTLLAVLSHAISQSPERDSSLARARSLAEEGELTSAQSVLATILSSVPQDLEARTLYARYLSWDGQYASAEAQYDSVLARDPSNEEALLGKAQVNAWSGRSEQAIEIVRALESARPPSKASQQLLGNIYLWSRRPSQALGHYERAYAMDSLDADVIRGIARCWLQAAEYQQAAHWYDKLLALSPDDPEALRERPRVVFVARREVQVFGEVESFSSEEIATSTILSAEYYHELQGGLKPFAHLGYSDRFSQTDVRFGGGAYVGLWSDLTLFGQLLVAPGSSVLPRVDITAESWFEGLEPVELLIGLRAMSFETSRVIVVSIGAQTELGSGFRVFPRLYWSRATDESSSLTGSLVLYKTLSAGTVLRAGGYVGSENFRATSLAQVSSRSSAGTHLGIRSRLSELFGIDGCVQYVWREDASDSALLTAVFIVFLR